MTAKLFGFEWCLRFVTDECQEETFESVFDAAQKLMGAAVLAQ
jgi:hypothetical protein